VNHSHLSDTVGVDNVVASEFHLRHLWRGQLPDQRSCESVKEKMPEALPRFKIKDESIEGLMNGTAFPVGPIDRQPGHAGVGVQARPIAP
jgi:hypothetical protein